MKTGYEIGFVEKNIGRENKGTIRSHRENVTFDIFEKNKNHISMRKKIIQYMYRKHKSMRNGR